MMSRTLVQARPYALAAFEYARAEGALSDWETLLSEVAVVVNDQAVADLLSKPQITGEALARFFCDVLESRIKPHQQNFIRLLAEKKRLPLLPQIYLLFKSYRAALEKIIKVNVTTAITLNEQLKDKMAVALANRFQQQVELDCEVDASLLGGAIISAGDYVIDGSVVGQLKRLLNSLTV